MIKFIVFLVGVTVAFGDKLTGEKERCYEALGCLVLDEAWWHPFLRPVNLWPQEPEVINTTFTLHTRPTVQAERAGQAGPRKLLDPKQQLDLVLSPLDATKPTKVIIHGYKESAQTPWVTELTAGLLLYGDYNVIVVDWENGAQTSYLQAVANARLVGLEVARLLNTLAGTINLPPRSVHLLGYTLGAHVAGYSGERVEGVGRITGLAPSALYFQELPPVVRLDETDAIFVDVIHTAGDGPGTSERCGTVDFYPNGGGDQPGCEDGTKDGTKDGTQDGTQDGGATKSLRGQSCSVMRAVDLFLASLLCHDCFLSHECTDQYLYNNGMCHWCGDPNTRCAYLGLRAEEFLAQRRVRVPLHLTTSATHPFNVYPYRVWFNLAHPEEAEDCLDGELMLTLRGTNAYLTITLPGAPLRLSHGQPRGWVVGLEEDLGAVEELVVYWQYQHKTFTDCCRKDCNTNLYIQAVKVTPIDYLPESKREKSTRLLCGGLLNTPVASGGSVTLQPKDTCQEWSV
ncbi:pancreatic lipase-related protein 2 isoform X2 [Procambarus clarkii]|uniref:pancreatic lipase-related protein 2 isoform X2 n=1 Tax=Procambarus clarkii TaxID=6728 RepID=UPI0037442873